MTVRTTILFALAAATLVGCASKSPAPSSKSSSRPGVYYKDDGPPSALPSDLDRVADAVPSDEPLHRFANRPYNVFGVNYTPMTLHAPLNQRGIASWYGRKFHGQKTAIGETYDMFAMSAAHPTAPLPSFARVTNPRNNKSVVVRINDRGPFLAGRIVDLSYAAAHRIGIVQQGSGEVEFELLLPPHFKSSSTRETVASSAPARADTPAISSASGDRSSMPATPPIAHDNRAIQQFFVQLGAFGNFGNAQAFQGRMADELGTQIVVRQVGGLFRVQLGPFASELEAQQARSAAQQRINPGAAPLPIITENAK
ncbi:MAG: septal ring lytic transglycosylase RlpA family protein [Casimicrobium sp.]